MNAPALAALRAVADPSRILFGTDYPMAPPFAIKASVDGLPALEMPPALRGDIGFANAGRLLGRGTSVGK